MKCIAVGAFRRSRRRFSTCETPSGVLQVVNLEVFQVGKSPRFSTWETSLTEQLSCCAKVALWGYRGVRKLPEIAPAQNNFYLTNCRKYDILQLELIECVSSAPINRKLHG